MNTSKSSLLNRAVLPAEPRLDRHARSFVHAHMLYSDEVAYANARTGVNAHLFPRIGARLEPSRDLSNVDKARPFESSAHWAQILADKAQYRGNDFPRMPSKAHCRCVPANATGLAPGSLDTLVVDHIQAETDPAAILAEARRLLRPRGTILLISYGRPHHGDSRADHLIDQYWRLLDKLPYRPFADLAAILDSEIGLETITTAGPAREFAATAKTDVGGLLAFIRSMPAAGHLERLDGSCYPSARFGSALATAWGSHKAKREIHFPVTVQVGVKSASTPVPDLASQLRLEV